MEDIVKYIFTNISILSVIAWPAKKLIEKYIESKVNHELAIRLESHKLNLQKDMEKYKEQLLSGRALKDQFVQRNIELMEYLGEIRSAVQFLIRAHGENDSAGIKSAWERYYSEIPKFEDFIARYSSPYLSEYEEDIKYLANSINEITKSIEEVKKQGGTTYQGNFQAVIDIADNLKKKIYDNLTQT